MSRQGATKGSPLFSLFLSPPFFFFKACFQCKTQSAMTSSLPLTCQESVSFLSILCSKSARQQGRFIQNGFSILAKGHVPVDFSRHVSEKCCSRPWTSLIPSEPFASPPESSNSSLNQRSLFPNFLPKARSEKNQKKASSFSKTPSNSL